MASERVFQEYEQIRSQLGKAVNRRQQLEAQLKENEMVQKEFQGLSAQAGIFKLIGPTLLKQERNEAMAHVKTRLEFIQSEIQKLEGELKSLEAQEKAKAEQLMQLQRQQTVPGTQ